MKFTADNNHIKEAINRIKIDLDDPKNKYPFITLLADENGAAIFATDQISFVESRFAASVEEIGSCQVGRNLGPILSSVRDSQITLSSNDKRLSITGDLGFKGRLQVVAGDAVPYEGIIEKVAAFEYTFQGKINRHDLASLLKLSTILPESDMEVTPCKYIILYINGEEVIGATHESAIGAVESMPLALVEYTQVTPDPIKVVLDSNRFKSLLDICDSVVEICANAADARHRIAVRVSDGSGLWWGFISQMQLRSEMTQ